MFVREDLNRIKFFDSVTFLSRPKSSLSSWCVFVGVPPTQVHKHGNVGCISVSAVLEPLDFVLPKREPVSPVLDLSIELSSLSTGEAEAPAPVDPSFSEKVESPVEAAPEPGAHLNLHVQQPQEAEPSPNSVQPKTHDVEQEDPGDTALTSTDDQNEALN